MTAASRSWIAATLVVVMLQGANEASSSPASLSQHSYVERNGEPDPRWAVEQGMQSARTELARCAASAKTEPCVRAVYRVCEREHGSSTHAMTDCTVYVARAAEGELSDAEYRARFWIKKHPGTAKAELARQAVRAQAAWKLRAVRACEHETGTSEDSALYQFRKYWCLAPRYAARTLVLERAIMPGG